jgi:hypothetical protein
VQRQYWALSAFAILLVGFLFNRVVFSVGIFFSCLYIVTSPNWWQSLWRNRFALSLLILFFYSVINISLHSTNLASLDTWHLLSLKLSAVVFPVFISLWSPDDKAKALVHYGLMVAVTSSALYGLIVYMSNQDQVLHLYKVAKVLPTLSLSDHIRMSWLTAISIWIAIFDLERTKQLKKWILIPFIVFSVIYLHILSAKTGLFVLYMMIFFYTIWKVFIKKSKIGYIILILGILFPILAYKNIPTFYNRAGFLRWNVVEYLRGNEHKGLSDGMRIASMKAGWHTFKNNVWLGVGPQHLTTKTNHWYKLYMPSLDASEYIVPSSQFLIIAAGLGVIGLLIFTGQIFVLLANTYKDWLVLSIVLPSLMTFGFETHLEGQLPIFVYAFVLYWVSCLVKKIE